MEPKRFPCPENDSRFDALVAEELRYTAYHEAGHCVMHILFGLPFYRVEVFTDAHPEPPDMKDYAGVVHRPWLGDCPDWVLPWHPTFHWDNARRHWYRLIGISLAGPLAEGIHTRKRVPKFLAKHDRYDIHFVGRYLMGLRYQKHTDELAAELEAPIREMLQLPVIWKAVDAIAQALIQRNILTASEVEALAESTCARGFRAVAKRHVRKISAHSASLINVRHKTPGSTSNETPNSLTQNTGLYQTQTKTLTLDFAARRR